MPIAEFTVRPSWALLIVLCHLWAHLAKRESIVERATHTQRNQPTPLQSSQLPSKDKGSRRIRVLFIVDKRRSGPKLRTPLGRLLVFFFHSDENTRRTEKPTNTTMLTMRDLVEMTERVCVEMETNTVGPMRGQELSNDVFVYMHHTHTHTQSF